METDLHTQLKTGGVVEELARETLDDFLKRRIAAKEGIAPEQVTPEYIQERREEQIYPDIRYEIGSDYGGYDTVGLKFRTRHELDEIERDVDEALAKL